MNRSSAVAVVLAAGKGTRMESELPKVLFPACGRPLVQYVLDALRDAGVGRLLVVVGYREELVRESLADQGVEFVTQTVQLGTGHAVQACREQLSGHDGPVLVLAGDSPLVQSMSLRELLAIYEQRRPACLLGTLHKSEPRGLGRIVRDSAGEFVGIVEEKDATDEQRRITEVNMSTYVFHGPDLLGALGELRDTNSQQELYLTDCPAILRGQGKLVLAEPLLRPCESLSVNNRDELRIVEAELRAQGLGADPH